MGKRGPRLKDIERTAIKFQQDAAWYNRIAFDQQSATYQRVAASMARMAWLYLDRCIKHKGGGY